MGTYYKFLDETHKNALDMFKYGYVLAEAMLPAEYALNNRVGEGIVLPASQWREIIDRIEPSPVRDNVLTWLRFRDGDIRLVWDASHDTYYLPDEESGWQETDAWEL